MPDGAGSGTLVQQIEGLLTVGVVGNLTDGELVDRFLRSRGDHSEAAFTALVQRHGPMVLRVCNITLKDHHAAEDAFQATFLVLARHASSIRKRQSVASWLFGVACRASARLRMAEARRRRREQVGDARMAAQAQASGLAEVPETFLDLHAEINRLPEKYRLPIVLCYFEGLTHDQAAYRLSWPVGTVKTRLSRAREQLRSRLERRGWTGLPIVPSPSYSAGALIEPAEPLLQSTVKAAIRLVSGTRPDGMVSVSVLTISQGVSRAMLIHKSRLAAMALFGMLGLGLGALVLAPQVAGKHPLGERGQVADSPDPRPTSTSLRLSGTTDYDPAVLTIVRAPFDGRIDNVLVDLGSTVKPGDPLLELFSTDLAVAKNEYETALSQHARDKKALDIKAPLVETNSIPRKGLIDAQNEEAKSKLQMKLAKDKLLVFGLSEEEIAAIPNEDGVKRARIILRSRGAGNVIKRSVVRGNFYDSKDELMQIVPLDHLWVRGDVSELDAERVQVGQKLKVVFPQSDRTFDAMVEYVDKAIDPETRSAKLRTSIPNPDHRIKAGLLVHIQIELPSGPRAETTTRDPARPMSGSAIIERCDAIERKLDQLLEQKHERTSSEQILDRLNKLERKVDQLLEERKRN